MMRDVRHALIAMVPILLVGAIAAADECCPVVFPRVIPVYSSPYACTEPAPPSRFPPVPIPNPFACDSPYCDPGYGGNPYGGNPYGGGPIPLPPPPGTGPYGAPPYGTYPYVVQSARDIPLRFGHRSRPAAGR